MLRARPDIQLYRRAIWGHPPPLESAIVPFAPTGFECVHTPGHSEDHHVVWDTETGTLFSGDLWLAIRSRVLHSSEDPYAIVESLRRAASLAPDRMFDAHRGLVENPVVALNAKADWLGEMMEAIAREIGEGWSDREIVNRLLEGEYRTAYISGGDYSRRNLVKAVRRRVADVILREPERSVIGRRRIAFLEAVSHGLGATAIPRRFAPQDDSRASLPSG